MSAKQLLGRPCADAIYDIVRNGLVGRHAQLVTVGFDEDRWNQYTCSLSKSAVNLGFACEEVALDANISPTEFARQVKILCSRADVTGLIVQQPLPSNYADVAYAIAVEKDVDCLNPMSIARLYRGEDGFRPATALAVIRLLDYYGIQLAGKHVVVIGRGSVGKPLSLMLLERNATVTICHSKTQTLADICKSADVLISACGVPGLVKENFVTDKSVVVDVGLSFLNGKTSGDVAAEVYDKCSAVSPVPGGIGPVTRAVLFENVLTAISKVK